MPLAGMVNPTSLSAGTSQPQRGARRLRYRRRPQWQPGRVTPCDLLGRSPRETRPGAREPVVHGWTGDPSRWVCPTPKCWHRESGVVLLAIHRRHPRLVPFRETPWDSRATKTSSMSLSVLEASPADLSEQLRANAPRTIAPSIYSSQDQDACRDRKSTRL